MLRPLCVLILLPALLLSETPAPRFKDYPAQGKFNAKNSPVLLTTKQDREFRTQLRSAARQHPNFAGHYIVAAWGCGSTCLMGAVIDANTGEVLWFPHTICCWPVEVSRPIVYRIDSTLIVFRGDRNEKEGDDGSHYYDFRDGKFVHVKSMSKYPEK